jgi:glucosamine 6-phosphate synthetase-like amidotransferase/phosphosugar isomerase protein
MKRKAEVDSEAIFRMMSYCLDNGKTMQEAIQATGKQLVGWFACAAVSIKNPYVLWIFRDRTPVQLFYYKSVGIMAFATDKNMVKEAFKDRSYGTPEEIDIKPHSGIGIDLWSGSAVKFKIDELYKSVHM